MPIALELGPEGWKPLVEASWLRHTPVLENPYRRQAVLRDLEEVYVD